MPDQNLLQRIGELEQKLSKLENLVATHQHNNSDGTIQLRKTIFLDQDQVYTVGSSQLGSLQRLNPTNGRQFYGVLATGPQMQQTTTNRFPNLQVVSRGLPDETSRLDGFYAQGSPIVIAFQGQTVSTTAGGSTVTVNNFNFANNELTGAYIIIYDSNGVAQEVQEIASNNATVVTISGTWWNTTSGGPFEIYSPVYLGDYNHPWKQVAVIDGDIPNGIRFGGGLGTNTTYGYLNVIGGPGQLVFQNSAGSVQLSAGIGVTDTFTTADLKTVTVLDGIIVSIV